MCQDTFPNEWKTMNESPKKGAERVLVITCVKQWNLITEHLYGEYRRFWLQPHAANADMPEMITQQTKVRKKENIRNFVIIHRSLNMIDCFRRNRCIALWFKQIYVFLMSEESYKVKEIEPIAAFAWATRQMRRIQGLLQLWVDCSNPAGGLRLIQ